MATGYLWTGQYEDCQSVIDNGKNQSMELDENSLDGHWSTNNKTGMDFFIINDAIFSKLCILGDDVEPCFEGARVTAPEVSTSFSKVDDTFKKTLYTMMQELKSALEGGQSNMDLDNKEEVVVETTEEVTEPAVDEVVTEENDKNEQPISTENQESIEAQSNDNSSFEKKDDDDDEKEEENSDKEENDDEEDKEKKYSLLESEYEELKTQYSELESQYQSLVEFKNQIENEKKDALINSFYMLADEDKADVIANKAKYSLDEIEAKLSVICVRKKVNFNLDDEEEASKDDKKDVEDVVTYSLNEEESSTPAWVSALRKTQKDKKEN